MRLSGPKRHNENSNNVIIVLLENGSGKSGHPKMGNGGI